MNARCTVCLERYQWVRPSGNVRLVRRGDQDILVCRKHDPRYGDKQHERNSPTNK